jgi:hypothetical protein
MLTITFRNRKIGAEPGHDFGLLIEKFRKIHRVTLAEDNPKPSRGRNSPKFERIQGAPVAHFGSANI